MARFALVFAISMMVGTIPANSAHQSSKKDFMLAMDEAVAKHNLELKNDKRIAHNRSRKKTFYKRLLQNAVLVEDADKKDEPDFMGKKSRKLGGDDDGANGDNGNYQAAYVDLEGYALKYIGCSQLASFSDYQAYTNADSVTVKQNFVSFRLCPYDTCSTKSDYGCGYNYGEYLVPMNDYLEAYESYKAEAFQQFCDYCDQCMYFEQYFYGNRKLEEEEDGDSANGGDGQHACKHYDSCVDYNDNCDNVDENEVSFDCAYVGKDSNGSYLYGSPYCSSDGYTIKSGLFSDDSCTTYVKDSRNDQSGVGTVIDGIKGLNSGECISCRKEDLPWTLPKGNNNNNNNNNGDDDQATLQFCENIYLSSAKCEKHMSSSPSSRAYQLSFLSYETDTQCLFIASAEKGNMDKNGVVLVPGEERIVDRNVALHTRAGMSRSIRTKLGTAKTCLLISLIMGCTCLLIAAWHMKRRLLWNAKKTQFLQRASEYPSQGNISPTAPPPPAEDASTSRNYDDLVELARNEDEEKLGKSKDVANDDVDDRILGLRGGSFESGRHFA
mmetsp:Transcript_8147/g.12505  ORF Transcript_8147/g.12505 Transcript_8147/m.12505 type:complete len:553 (+) Transcript_8147:42-1700(+)